MSVKGSRIKNLKEPKPTTGKKSLQKVVGTPDVLQVKRDLGVPQPGAFRQATGVQNGALARELVRQAADLQLGIMRRGGPPPSGQERLDVVVATLGGLGPENATQAMLAVQMVGVHEAALRFLRRVSDGQNLESSNSDVLQVTRLLRLFNEQLEAMAKLKGKSGQQKVTVEHVHVYDGGKAIVGAMAEGPGDGKKDG
jgi:hypothetical protein